jgi:hypothetical protein
VFTGLGFGAGRAWEECDSVSHKLFLGHLREPATIAGRVAISQVAPTMAYRRCVVAASR